MFGSPAQIILFITIFIALAAILAGAESAISRVSKIRAQQLLAEGRRGSTALVAVTSDYAPYAAVTTFVRVVGESLAAVLVTVLAVDLVGPGLLALVTAVSAMTLISFVLVGVSPRTLGRQHFELVALGSAPLVSALRRVLGPLARLLVLIGNAVTPGKGLPNGPFATEVELRELVDIAGAESVIEPAEQEMLHSVFELSDTLAREVMVPRTDMVTIDHDRVLRQALSLFLRSGFSRIPVIDEGADDIRGMLYLKDVSRRVFHDPASEKQVLVTEVMRPVKFVPESKPVDDLLREMQRDQNHMAVVIDEYGGTAGLVSIEDILEEIVGEITDEYDREDPPVERLPDGTLRVRATLPVDDLGELFHKNISTQDVDTVAGLLARELGRVPIPGARAIISGLELTAERPAGRRHRIATVIVRELSK